MIGVLFVVLATAHALDKSNHDTVFKRDEFVCDIWIPTNKVIRSNDHSFDGALADALTEDLQPTADDEVVLVRQFMKMVAARAAFVRRNDDAMLLRVLNKYIGDSAAEIPEVYLLVLTLHFAHLFCQFTPVLEDKAPSVFGSYH